MVKGCSKRVVVVHDPENPLFEEAFFVVRPENAASHTKQDCEKQAHRLFVSSGKALSDSRAFPQTSNTDKSKRKHMRFWTGTVFFLGGFALGVLLCAFIYYANMPI